jgi:L-cystine uptake protein TcyP (sodium:dicarboxylate symporter family)
LVGLLTLVPLYFVLQFYRQAVFVALAVVMVAVSGVGMYLSAGTASASLFQALCILSLISLPITIIHFILSFMRELLEKVIARGKGL